MYDRKIIYLHRYEGEMDKGNVGYIKQENRNGTCSFMVSLMNMPSTYQADTALVLLPIQHILCRVHIKDGKGQGMAICEDKQLAEAGIPYEKISRYEIQISEDIHIRGEISAPKKPREEVAPIERAAVNIPAKNTPSEDVLVADMPDTKQSENQEKVEAAWIQGNYAPKMPFSDLTYQEPRETYKNKWEQLSSGRKRVNLMGKESDYIQITPKDMIALSSPYHGLVNNAFLLHGYYNYNHLILGPAKGHKGLYFIGVPGNFYKQEVNAARMFGFEYFENGGDKVEVGDFGYYMKKVKL